MTIAKLTILDESTGTIESIEGPEKLGLDTEDACTWLSRFLDEQYRLTVLHNPVRKISTPLDSPPHTT